MNEAPFEILEDQLKLPASRKTWRVITQWLESFEDEEALEDEVLPAIQSKLDHWDDVQRVAHPDWIARLLEGEFVPHLYSVRTLDLNCQGILFQEAELLAESPELEMITRLLLPYNGLQDEGTQAIAQSEFFSNVYHLDLAGNSVGDEGIEALLSSPYMKRLTYLDLTGNWVNDESAQILADAKQFENLETLVLRGNPIRAEGAHALAHSEYLSESIKNHWREHL